MAGERKTHPVGWEAFIETAKKYGATRDVLARLIARTPDSPAKVCINSGVWQGDKTSVASELTHRLSSASACLIMLVACYATGSQSNFQTTPSAAADAAAG
jgi:hypothetical protein